MREYSICEAADLATEIADRISEEVAHEFNLLDTLDISDDIDFTNVSDRIANANFDRVLDALSVAHKVFDVLL